MSKLGFSSFSVCYFLCVMWNTGVSQVTWVYYAEDCQHIPYRLHGDSDIYTAVKTPVFYDHPSSEWGEHRKRKTEQRLHKKQLKKLLNEALFSNPFLKSSRIPAQPFQHLMGILEFCLECHQTPSGPVGPGMMSVRNVGQLFLLSATHGDMIA